MPRPLCSPAFLALKPYHAKALRQLSGDGFRVGGTRGICSNRCYTQLRAAGYLEEHWTWASTTRPDCGISEAGREALAEYDRLQASEAERLYLATEAADLAPVTEADRRAAREDNWFSRNHASDKAFAMRNGGQRERE